MDVGVGTVGRGYIAMTSPMLNMCGIARWVASADTVVVYLRVDRTSITGPRARVIRRCVRKAA
jgi:hypothetical protein